MMNGQKVAKVFAMRMQASENSTSLYEALYTSADRANTFANILDRSTHSSAISAGVICAIVGGVLALNGFGGFTLGGLASFLTFNKSFNMPINQVSQQFNAIVMAMAGADRIFRLMDEPVEKDDGYVLLVNAKEENGKSARKYCPHRTMGVEAHAPGGRPSRLQGAARRRRIRRRGLRLHG